MTKERTNYILIIFGLLDLVSFMRTYKMIQFNWDGIFFAISADLTFWNRVLGIVTPILYLALIFMLVPSGLLLILKNKLGLIIYYLEFPLRLFFVTLTFGFVIKFLGLQMGTLTYTLMMTLVYILEIGRLVFTIWSHKKYYTVGQTASP
jgi:hypothetical protein